MNEQSVTETQVSAMVRRFYALSLEDDLLGPLFRASIDDLEAHMGIVDDFWSHVLLGTDRYKRGTPYTHHLGLTVEMAHFDRWMALFEQATGDILPPDAATLAMKRAAHMTKSFKAGMLPLPERASQHSNRSTAA